MNYSSVGEIGFLNNRVVRKHSVSEQLPFENAFSQAESRHTEGMQNAGLVRQPTGLSNKSVVQEFENKVSSVLKDACHGCGSDGTIFLAAVSGGADSMAMLCALSVLIPPERLFCLHVEHGLRPERESKGDAEFVGDFCKKLGINFRLKTIASGKIASFSRRRGTGIEAAARHFRRKALFKEAARLGNNTIILTAHTKDDALELALMRILRGSGPEGLAAMPVRKGNFFRPLLSVSRAGVINYLKEKKITWREDSTNKNEKFLRNKVRLQLIPLLNKFFPSWEKGLAGMTGTQSITAAFISDEAQRRICWEREGLPDKTGGALVTNSENFFSQPQIIREEALFQGIGLLMAKKSSVPVKRSVIRRFCAGTVKSADLGTFRVKQKDAKITLFYACDNYFETGFSLLINKPGLYNLNSVGIEILPYSPESEGSKRSFCSFCAAMPLVFRRSFKDDFLENNGKKVAQRKLGKKTISAVDMLGTAAFIYKTEILFARDFVPEAHNNPVYLVKVFQNKSRFRKDADNAF